MKKDLKTLCLTLLLVMSVVMGKAQSNVIDEVIWVVGDQPILRSEVEFQRLSAEMNHEKIAGDPYTVIPEMLAINKLFLHQASIDSINVSEADVIRSANEQLNQWIQSAGSQEKLEEYQGMSIKQIRQEIVRYFVETEKISEAKSKILGQPAYDSRARRGTDSHPVAGSFAGGNRPCEKRIDGLCQARKRR